MAYDKFEEDMKRWNLGMKAYYHHKKSHFESLPDTEGEIIFLGNSLIDNCDWAELFQNPNIKNRGVGGDDTDGVLERLDEVTSSRPEKIFIMIGTNDLAYGKTVDVILSNYRKIIERIMEESPETKIYLQSVLPTDDGFYPDRSNDDIMKINRGLNELAAEKGLVYIDLYTSFENDQGILDTKYSLDGLHIKGEGYRLWKSLIEKYVQ